MKTYYAIFYRDRKKNGFSICPSWNTNKYLDGIWDCFQDKQTALKYYKELVDRYGSKYVLFVEINGDIRDEHENEKEYKMKQLDIQINRKKKELEEINIQIKDLQRERD